MGTNNIRHYYDTKRGRGFTMCGEGVIRGRYIDPAWPDCAECADEVRRYWDADVLKTVRTRTTRILMAREERTG